MKKKSLALVFMILAVMSTSIGIGAGSKGIYIQTHGQVVLINGLYALKDGNKTYYLKGLGQDATFLEGWKEGATINVDGYIDDDKVIFPDVYFLDVQRVVINGRVYFLDEHDDDHHHHH